MIHDDIPEATYRAMPGLSGTEVAKILDNPADLKWARENPTPSTASMSLGTLVHAMVLDQPTNAVVSEYPDFRTNAAKAWRAEVEAEGLTVVKAEDYEQAETMRDAVLANATAAKLLAAPGRSEVTVTGERRGAPLKGRIDRLADSGLVIDLKTTRDVSVGAFERALSDYGYACQVAHYAALAGSDQRPVFIAVRNERRPAVAVHRIGATTWEAARRAVAEAWNRYADCIEADSWPDLHADGITDIDMKPWALDALARQITTGLEDPA